MTPEQLNFAAWRSVETRVAELLPRAFAVKSAHTRAALPTALFGPAAASWEPDTNCVRIYVAQPLWEKAAAAYQKNIPGDYTVVFAETGFDPAREILVKHAAWPSLQGVLRGAQNAVGAVARLPGQAATATHQVLGGPNPLSNALVTGLVAGGLGYGGGALLENLFPDRYVERGRLRRTLGLLGGGVGLGFGALQAAANQNTLGGSYGANWLVPSDLIERSRAGSLGEKQSNFPPPDLGGFQSRPLISSNSGLAAPTVDVRRMNDAIWNDARRGFYAGFQQHTNPAYAAAVSGMMTGLSTGLRSPIIRPIDVVRDIASAGVGLATAHVAGRTLSALAGLTPAAQNTLQDMGLWGGMMHAIVPPMLGLR